MADIAMTGHSGASWNGIIGTLAMNTNYHDILTRIAEPPRWFDEYAVPRWGDFKPSMTANIYCNEAALVEIACQGCGRKFEVAFSHHRGRPDNGVQTMADAIRTRNLHYGDPPNVGCCAAGPSMNSEPHRVLQYWSRSGISEWTRDASLEIDITPDWVRPRQAES